MANDTWEQLISLFSGEMREFLPAHLGNLDWSSRARSLSGHLVESLESGYAIHLRISLSELEGDALMGALGVYRMEDCPVVEMEGDMEVVDAEFECRDQYRSTIGSNGQFKNLERFLSHKMIFRLFLYLFESKSCFSFILSVLDSRQMRE